jgi:hypothetical protein
MAKIFGSAIQSTVVTPNQPTFRVEVITVPLAGTPVQLPDISIPDGVEIAIRALQNGARRVLLANSSANTGISTKRTELRSGEAIGLALTNTNLIWIDATGNNTSIEIIIET